VAGSTDHSAARARIDILGIGLDLLTGSEAMAWLQSALSDPWDGQCRHIVTLNPEYVMAAHEDGAFRDAISRADLVTADGVGITVAAKLVHGAAVDRVTGVTLVDLLAAASGPARAPMFLLGAGQGVADEAIARLTDRHPGLLSAGTWADGSAAPAHDGPALDRIAAGKARIVAVAYGAPGQVLWIDRNRERMAERGVRVAIGVGGALDYLSGAVEQPSPLAQRLGLEWLVRLVREPRRWRRQTVLPVFAFLVLVEAAQRRLPGGSRQR
jgi:N-acetylglucosaminyldiphosphoundecaprenol N-acetyl-beta-D-mannosaminyltransferase